MQEKLLQIINHYGIDNQLRQFTEEYFELVEAIIKAENEFEPIQDIDHIAEEIADCLNLLSQFAEYYKIDDEQVYNIAAFKVNRQLERIANEDKV